MINDTRTCLKQHTMQHTCIQNIGKVMAKIRLEVSATTQFNTPHCSGVRTYVQCVKYYENVNFYLARDKLAKHNIK